MGDDAILAATEAVKDSSTGYLATFFSSAFGHGVLTALMICVILLITLFLKRFAVFCLRRIEQRLRDTGNASGAAVIGFTVHLSAALIYLAGGIVAISCIPALESALNRLLAAGGILAVVVGLAAQEALGSMVSGLMLLAFKPFNLGDVVRYVDNDISGVIDEITVHHTTIRTWENKRVIIPNSKMNSTIIENADYADSKICVFFEVGVTYESDLELAKTLLAKEIQSHPDFFDYRTDAEKDACADAVVVRVAALADSSVVLRAFLWAKDSGTAARMKSDLFQSIKATYDASGVDIAYPHLVVVNK